MTRVTQLPSSKGQYDSYEVFVQYNVSEHHQHVGSLLAPSPDVALQMARENFLRRDTAVNIWVVRTEHIFATSYEDTSFFAEGLDKSFRRVDGYSAENARRWKAFKQKALQLEDIVADVEAGATDE